MTTPTTEATRFVRWGTVQARYGLSRSTIWRWVRAGTFPAPVKLGNTRSVFWRAEDLDLWEEDTKREGRPAP